MKDGFARARHRIDLTTELKSRDKSLPNGVASSRTNQDARIGVRCLYSHGPYFEKVNYGRDGFDDREKQSIAGMLRIPFMDSWGPATVDPPSLPPTPTVEETDVFACSMIHWPAREDKGQIRTNRTRNSPPPWV
jgi:hypothetical protein